MTRRLDLTDEQWARLEPLLPAPTRSGRPLIEGIRWRVRGRWALAGRPGPPRLLAGGGCAVAAVATGRAVPPGAQVVTALPTRADAAGLITWGVSVDSTTARAHQHAAGARRHPWLRQEPPGGLSAEPDDHALGAPAAG